MTLQVDNSQADELGHLYSEGERLLSRIQLCRERRKQTQEKEILLWLKHMGKKAKVMSRLKIYNTKTQKGMYGLNHIEQKYQRNWYW